MLKRNFLYERIHRYPRIGPGKSRGGQGMVCSRGVISGCLRREVSEKYRARIAYLRNERFVFLTCNDQVLAGVMIGKSNRFLQVGGFDREGVAQCLPCNFHARQLDRKSV